MKRFSIRRPVACLVLAMPLLAGCAGDVCERLAFEQEPRDAPALSMPEGVAAVPEGGEYRVPDARGEPADAGRCLARPPMTLPPEVLEEPEETDEAA